MSRVLYVAYWGLREPLGQSLVLPAVRAFAEHGHEVELVTFDKPADLADRAAVENLRSELGERGVRWRPLRYHKRPTLPATAFDVLQGVAAVLWTMRRGRPAIVHARTFIGGVIATIAHAVTRVPWVYHNEGFWPDQQVEGGFWSRESAIYRLMKAIEKQLYRRAGGVIALSRRSLPAIEGYRHGLPAVPLVVVPSCVDLGAFGCPERSRPRGPRLVYVGSLHGRYDVDGMAGFVRAVVRRSPTVTLTVLSQSAHGPIRDAFLRAGLEPATFTLGHVAHRDVPRHLCDADAGLLFQHGGIGSLSGSPTKVGEYWAAGLPVVTSAGIGDPEDVVRERRVGVVVPTNDEAGWDAAARELLELLQDGAVAARCRAAARATYALEDGVRTQLELHRLVGRAS